MDVELKKKKSNVKILSGTGLPNDPYIVGL